MKVLAFARDPGGANTLVPVVKALLSADRGAVRLFGQDWALSIYSQYGLKARPLSDETLSQELRKGTDVVLTGTSWPPESEIKIWESAHDAGIPSVAVLDFWSNYRARFCDKKGIPHWPTLITTMDPTAQREMVAEGIPPDRLVITGQPFLEMRARELRAASHHLPIHDRRILFLSQPLSTYPNAKNLPFNEYSVLELVAKAVDSLPPLKKGRLTFVLRPHPKDDLPGLTAVLKRCMRHIPWTVEKGDGTDAGILRSHVIVGIYTMLLVESALAGRPIISLQPGLPEPDHFVLSRLKYITRIGDGRSFARALRRTLNLKTGNVSGAFMRPHQGATARVIEVLKRVAVERMAIPS